jgi:flavin reductase (DIM6/NTAB) family NADH-FMN oxidoreductase RutF
VSDVRHGAGGPRAAARRAGAASDMGRALRTAMGHFATGVCVVSTRRADGAAVGTTVNAVSSVSLEPPLLLVCLARDSETLAALRRRGRFAVNVLCEEQREHSRRFASKGASACAHEVCFDEHALGVPCLPESLATIVCELHSVCDGGDHEVVLGRALAMSSAGDGAELAPLLFFRGAYSRLERELLAA